MFIPTADQSYFERSVNVCFVLVFYPRYIYNDIVFLENNRKAFTDLAGMTNGSKGISETT